MKQQDYTGIVPDQHTGKEIEAVAFVEITDEGEAKDFYEIVKGRLQDVNKWHEYAGALSAKFQVVDADCKEVDRYADKDDFIKIDIPGPGSNEGEGYDWVLVEELKEMTGGDVQSFAIRVRPCKNPCGKKKDIAHFYSGETTGNFMVTRERSKVSTCIVDRNVLPNDHAESVTDKIRDIAIGIGAVGMFSRIQWQQLANGLLNR